MTDAVAQAARAATRPRPVGLRVGIRTAPRPDSAGRSYARPVHIRDAEDADWEMVYPFWSAIVAAGETYAYPALSFDDARAQWMPQPPWRTVVAADGDRVLGSVLMGPNRPGRGSHIATASFMVDPAHGRRGVGRALGLCALEWARREGYHGMQFNAVVETNVAAARLWQSLGFQIVGTVPDAFDHARFGLVGLHVMYQRLAP